MTISEQQIARVQQPAPHFAGKAVVNGQFEDVSLDQLRGKWVLLFFYPMDFTFVCPTEICAFNDAAAAFKELNCEVIACSTDSEYSHLAWTNLPREKGGLGETQIALLADPSHAISRDYGVLLDGGIALRGSFLIDPKGTLRQMTVNDLPVGRSVDEAMRLLKAFQFTDVHGEVCPIDWDPKKNARTMIADPKKSQEYFAENAKRMRM